MDTRRCCTCFKNKQVTVNKRVGKGFYDFCPECWEDMKWTQASLRSGTDKLTTKYPDKYIKNSQFSVISEEVQKYCCNPLK